MQTKAPLILRVRLSPLGFDRMGKRPCGTRSPRAGRAPIGYLADMAVDFSTMPTADVPLSSLSIGTWFAYTGKPYKSQSDLGGGNFRCTAFNSGGMYEQTISGGTLVFPLANPDIVLTWA